MAQDLTKEFLEAEIKKSEITIKTIEEGLAINTLILHAFEAELKRCGKK